MLHGRILLSLVLLLLLVNFVSEFRLELIYIYIYIYIYIPHKKYQLKPHSYPGFSAASGAVIVHINHFFPLYQRINLLILKKTSYRLVILAKVFLKLQNLHMLIKQKSPLFPRNLVLVTFSKLLIVFSTKVNLLYLLY